MKEIASSSLVTVIVQAATGAPEKETTAETDVPATTRIREEIASRNAEDLMTILEMQMTIEIGVTAVTEAEIVIGTGIPARITTGTGTGTLTELMATGIEIGIVIGIATEIATGIATGIATETGTGIATGIVTGIGIGIATGTVTGTVTGIAKGIATRIAIEIGKGTTRGTGTKRRLAEIVGILTGTTMSVRLGEMVTDIQIVGTATTEMPTRGKNAEIGITGGQTTEM